MAQQKKRKNAKNKNALSFYSFLLAAVVLAIGAMFLGTQAMSQWRAYAAEAAVTPVPTATVLPVSMTPGPEWAGVSFELSVGSKGDRVVALQTRLQELGYYTGAIDGDYGSGTKAAVTLFQQRNGLQADGIAGQATQAALNDEKAKPAFEETTEPPAASTQAPAANDAAAPLASVLRSTTTTLNVGSKGAQVEALQSRLQELGYYTGAIDGDYGSGTKAAVTLFQQVNGLTADGIAGPKTLTALYDDSAQAKPEPMDTLAGDIPLLVNKWNALPGGFEPADLVRVQDIVGKRMTYQSDNLLGVREAAEALARMIQAALDDGCGPWKLRESYRTIADQQRILDNRVESYMKNDGATRSQALSRARREVADPGSSEHHTGLAFDLNVPGESFGDTAQYLWLKNNCWDYGFIMRYTDEKDDITGITGEEWHVRYVGVEHAQKMRELDYCLEEYVEWMQNAE